MLDTSTKAGLKAALERLQATRSGGAWDTIEILHDLSRSGLDFVIDLQASDEIGAPLIVARARREMPDWMPALTPAQRRVAKLVLNGLSNKAIARESGLSVATVKDHVHAILATTGFSSRAQLISNTIDQRGSG